LNGTILNIRIQVREYDSPIKMHKVCEMVLCVFALIVFSIMGIGSAKYRPLAREAVKCVTKTLLLSPCDMAVEQRLKAKATGKLLKFYPPLARFFYWNFKAFAWAFTAFFFGSLAYTAYSIYNFFVYGSCEPGGVCYLTMIDWCILEIEKVAIYATLAILVAVILYLAIKTKITSH